MKMDKFEENEFEKEDYQVTLEAAKKKEWYSLMN